MNRGSESYLSRSLQLMSAAVYRPKLQGLGGLYNPCSARHHLSLESIPKEGKHPPVVAAAVVGGRSHLFLATDGLQSVNWSPQCAGISWSAVGSPLIAVISPGDQTQTFWFNQALVAFSSHELKKKFYGLMTKNIWLHAKLFADIWRYNLLVDMLVYQTVLCLLRTSV